MSDLKEIRGQIQALEKQAAEMKARDFSKTVQEIREKMEIFGITIKDLATGKQGSRVGKIKKEAALKKTLVPNEKKLASKSVAAKFRGPNGETWSGRGLSPRWLTSLIAQGAKREDFAIAS